MNDIDLGPTGHGGNHIYAHQAADGVHMGARAGCDRCRPAKTPTHGHFDLLLLPRAKGKTSEILRWMAEAPENEVRVLVSHTAEESMRVYRSTFDDSNRSPFESWQFVSWREAQSRDIWGGVRMAHNKLRFVLAVDNFDLILRDLIPWQIGLVTMSTQESPA